jgi:hypothetical protein
LRILPVTVISSSGSSSAIATGIENMKDTSIKLDKLPICRVLARKCLVKLLDRRFVESIFLFISGFLRFITKKFWVEALNEKIVKLLEVKFSMILNRLK